EALYFRRAAVQPNFRGLVRVSGLENAIDLIAGMSAPGDFREFRNSHAGTGPRYDVRLSGEGLRQLTAIDEDRARDAHHQDVEGENQAAPEVNLEQRLPQPHALGVAQPALRQGHVVLRSSEAR